MKKVLKLIALIFALSPIYALGGGDPEFIKFPTGYDKFFKNYAIVNRANQKQVAKLYANIATVASYAQGIHAVSGSIVVMEIYSTKSDADGQPIIGSDGLFEIDKLEAVAVMEKNTFWDDGYPKENRVGNWGFALYNPDATPQSNDLDCVQCHTPLKDQDHLFSYQELIEFTKRISIR
jgi:hypothetical protein